MLELGIYLSYDLPKLSKEGRCMFPNINAERARMGWTLSDFADHLGVSLSTVKKWMNGTTKIPAPKIVEMSKLFHCSTDYLLGLNNNTTT